MKKRSKTGLGTIVKTTTDVVLTDGTSLAVTLAVYYKGTPRSEEYTRGAIFGWFYGNGQSGTLTLARLLADSNYVGQFLDTMKANHGADNVDLLGLSVQAPPLDHSFEHKAKKVTAILASGETVRMTFGTPAGRNNVEPPSAWDVARAFELLSTLRFSDLRNINALLNAKLKEPNQGWDYYVLGLERIGWPCAGQSQPKARSRKPRGSMS